MILKSTNNSIVHFYLFGFQYFLLFGHQSFRKERHLNDFTIHPCFTSSSGIELICTYKYHRKSELILLHYYIFSLSKKEDIQSALVV
jgi:hypothetical protein